MRSGIAYLRFRTRMEYFGLEVRKFMFVVGRRRAKVMSRHI